MAAATIKVRVGDELRRFGIARTATWADVESKLRELLNVPTLAAYTVTYVDEDGDAVAVGSDAELRELLARPTPLRLTVEPRGATTSSSDDGVAVERDASDNEDGFVDLAAETAAPAPAPAPAPQRLAETVLVEEVPDISDLMATDNVAAAPAASSSSSAAATTKPTAAAPAAAAAAASSSSSAATPKPAAAPAAAQDPLGALFEQLQTLVETAVERNGDLIERGGQLFEQMAHEARAQAEAARREHAERVQAEWARRRAAWEAHRAAWFNAQQPPSRRVATGKVPATADDSDSDSAASAAYTCNAAGACGPSSAWQRAGRGCGGAAERGFDLSAFFRQPFAQGLAQLHELGFDDDELNHQLLRLFNGNIAAVVNALA